MRHDLIANTAVASVRSQLKFVQYYRSLVTRKSQFVFVVVRFWFRFKTATVNLEICIHFNQSSLLIVAKQTMSMQHLARLSRKYPVQLL